MRISIDSRMARWLSVLCLAAAALATPGAADPARWALVDLEGSVEVGRGAAPVWHAAQAGEPLRGGDAVRTGPASRAEIAGAGRTVRLYEKSLLRLPTGPSAVRLDAGHSLVDVVPGAAGETPFQVETPEIVAVVKGTRFLVGADPDGETPLAVYEGEVSVRLVHDAEAFPVLVRPGFALELGRSRAMRLYLHGQDDPWPAWSSRGGRAPHFDARSAQRSEEVRRSLRESAEPLLPPRAVDPRPAAADLDPVQDVEERRRALEEVDRLGDLPSTTPEPPPPAPTPPPPPPPSDDDDDGDD